MSGALVALLAFGAAPGLALWWQRGGRPFPHLALPVAQAYALWLGLGAIQPLIPAAWPLQAGYVVLPLALALTIACAAMNLGPGARATLVSTRYRGWVLAGAAGYTAFYLYATRLVGPPDASVAGPPSMPADGFLVLAAVYGPLTIWPVVEFWVPALNLFGAVSVGHAGLVATLAGLAGASLALVVRALRLDSGCRPAVASLAGSAGAALATTFCCCCPPVLTPVLALFVGSVAASPAAGLFMGSSSPLYHPLQVGTLALTLAGVLLLGRRVGTAPRPVRRAQQQA